METLGLVSLLVVLFILKIWRDSARFNELERQMTVVLDHLKRQAGPSEHLGSNKTELRVATTRAVVMTIRGEKVVGSLADLSLSGAQVCIDAEMAVNEDVGCFVPSWNLQTSARVKRVVQKGRYGVAFTDVSESAQKILRDMVNQKLWSVKP